MASKNLKKVIRAIYKNAKEKDARKRTFDPRKYPVNWANAVRYVNAQGRRQQFKKLFKPLFKETLAAEFKMYADGGHKITGALRKEMIQYVKDKAKQTVKAQIAAEAAAKQSLKEQENVLPEG